MKAKAAAEAEAKAKAKAEAEAKVATQREPYTAPSQNAPATTQTATTNSHTRPDNQTKGNGSSQADAKEGEAREKSGKVKYTSILEFGYTATTKHLNAISAFDRMIGVNYIGGCKFGKMLFLGVGAGVEYNMKHTAINYSNISYTQLGLGLGERLSFGAIQLSKVDIPVYLHFRANLSKGEKVRPYIALSAGAHLSPLKDIYFFTNSHKLALYQMGLLGKVSLGVDFHINNSSTMFVGVGYRIDNRWGAGIVGGGKKVYTEKFWVNGLSVNLGFTF